VFVEYQNVKYRQ